ncbi:MAG TPA: YaaA family protein [Candidatus Megaira endosymbiont of Hartmannula sinica]|nr:YaaA family protein [Candidatus Megaera endosymbiont of Hartmannula sinica]
MLIIISPAKTMNFKDHSKKGKEEKEIIPSIGKDKKIQTIFDNKTSKIINSLKKLSIHELENKMKISNNIAKNLYELIKNYHQLESKQSLFAYSGDVYKNIYPQDFTKEDLKFASSHLRIISGLYGILSPIENIVAYRLEMKISLEISEDQGKIKNIKLSKFWHEEITSYINNELSLHKNKILINLASDEYSEAINSNLKYKKINILFRDKIDNNLKNIAVNSKRARGLISRFIIKNKIDDPNKIKEFNESAYIFSKEYSNENNFYFVRNR